MADPLSEEEAIFYAALAIDAADERTAYLDTACGNQEELRRRVEALLRRNAESAGPLDRPPGAPGATTPELPAERPGVMIGPYTLLEQVGEGGMGTVWLAQQTEPVKRQVAVKLIKAGMDSRQVLARFEAERQALALMDHVNIARVLDAGTTGTGRPYFVMDLVKGVPITRYCDEHHLTLRQRLELFIPVCQAVQHAHQKGIIHRDLKPSNVLVALYDGKPVPKVIDFGVAKAVGQSLTEKTLVTGLGTIVGTLEYMSPEQAELDQLDVDTRSDIYSLGVLLYELVTGSTPFSRRELTQAGMLEMLRVIREQEPSAPSSKLSTAEGLPTLAANRGMEPAKLTRLVRGELDWIVMKALEKDRSHRYETATGFAMDLQRYLADEAVLACPPSAGYRLRKFVRRNKGPVLAALIVALALVGGIIGTTWGLLRAEQARQGEAKQRQIAQTKERHALASAEQERRAKQREAVQRAIAEIRRKEAESQGQRAERNFGKARDAVDQTLTAVAENQLAQTPQMEPLRRELLEKAARFYEDFLKDESKDPKVRAGVAHVYLRLGWLYRLLGHPPQSLDAYRRAVKVLEELAAEHPSEPTYRSTLADALATSANPLLNLDRFPEAEKAYRRAIEINDALSLQFPGDMSYLQRRVSFRLALAAPLRYMRRFKEAEEAVQQSLAILEKLPADDRRTSRELLNTFRSLAEEFAHAQRTREAEQLYGKVLNLGLELLAESPRDPELRLGVAWTQRLLALLFRDTNRPQDAEKLLRESIGRVGGVVSDFPHTAHYRMSLVGQSLDLIQLLVSAQRFDEANKLLRESLPHAEKLVADAPERPWHHKLLGQYYFELAGLLSLKGQETEAERYCLKYLETRQHEPVAYNDAAWLFATRPEFQSHNPARAVAFAKKAVELVPDNGSFVNTLGTAYYRAGDWKAASETLKKSDELTRGTAFGHNGFFIAMAQEQLGARDDARRRYTAALVWMEKRAPKNEELVRFRAEAAALLGLSEKAADLAPQALSDDLQYLALILEADARAAWAYQQRAEVHLSRREYETAIPDLKKAVELDPKNATLHLQLGIVLEKQGELDEAFIVLRQAIELYPKDANSYRRLAHSLLDLKRPDHDNDRLRKATERKPSAATAYMILGGVLRERKKRDEAVACYQHAIELDPTSADLYYFMGITLLENYEDPRKVDEAAAYFQKGIKLDPKHLSCRWGLGRARHRQKRLDDAFACFQSCLEVMPDHATALWSLGFVLLDQQKPHEAVVSFRKSVALNPNHSYAQYGLGRALMELREQPEEALAALRRSIELDPKRVDAHYQLGVLLRRQNHSDQAAACFRKAIALNPNHATAQRDLGSMLAIQGKTDAGIALMRRAVELNPKLGGSHIELAWHLATAADARLRDPKAAVSHARTAMALQPDHPNYWRILGVALLRDGDHQAAAAALEKFEKMTNGNNHHHGFFLAMAYWRLGQRDKAVQTYERTLRWMDKDQLRNEELRRFRAEASELLERKVK